MFVTPDPSLPNYSDSKKEFVYDPQMANKYVYCRNNPLKYVDPTGCKLIENIVNGKSSYVDVNVVERFNDFIDECKNEGITFGVEDAFRDNVKQSHFHGIKNSNVKADQDDATKHGLGKVNPSGKSFHEVGAGFDLDLKGLTEEQIEKVVEIAQKYGFERTVMPDETWHFGDVGTQTGTTDKTINRDKFAQELGYKDWETMLKENQKDYIDKGNKPYTCRFGNTTGIPQ